MAQFVNLKSIQGDLLMHYWCYLYNTWRAGSAQYDDIKSLVLSNSFQWWVIAADGRDGWTDRHEENHVSQFSKGIMHPKDADGTSVDPDRTAPSSPIWVCTICLDFYTLR